MNCSHEIIRETITRLIGIVTHRSGETPKIRLKENFTAATLRVDQ